MAVRGVQRVTEAPGSDALCGVAESSGFTLPTSTPGIETARSAQRRPSGWRQNPRSGSRPPASGGRGSRDRLDHLRGPEPALEQERERRSRRRLVPAAAEGEAGYHDLVVFQHDGAVLQQGVTAPK